MCLDDDVSVDWVLRHGRCVALSVAVMESADALMTDTYKDKVEKAALSFAQSDRVRSTPET